MSQFVRKSDGGITYYYLGNKKPKWLHYDKTDIEGVLDHVRTKGLDQYVDLEDNGLVLSARGDTVLNTVELPTGHYTFKHGQYPMPDEFVFEKEIRKDEGYLEVPELAALRKDLHLFLDSQDIYKELATPYRRGYLLYGSPGNGKTALIRSLVQNELFKDMHIIWSNAVPSEKFVNALNLIPTRKLFIFEEIINQNFQLDFDMTSFLNFMDGENLMKNTITIATTNYPERLTENLADRPSRFDVVVRFDNPGRDMLAKTFKEYLTDDSDIDYLVNLKFSFAHVKEVILLHKMYKISIREACQRILSQREQFKTGFEEKKSFGIGI